MTRFVSLRPVTVLLVALALVVLTDRAAAQDRQHHSRGTAQFVSPTDFVGSGHATHLGKYTEVGCVHFSPTKEETVLQIDAWSVYTAANGDQLYATFTGRLDAVTGVITATATYVGGTGRFDDAGGTAVLSGQLLPDGSIEVAVKGTIGY